MSNLPDRVAAMVVLVSLFFVAGCSTGTAPATAPSATAPPATAAANTPNSYTVMSFNVRYDNPSDPIVWAERLPAIGAMFHDIKPDIIGAQEALHHQVEDLHNALPNTYSWVGNGRDDGQQAGEYAPIFYRADKFKLIDSGMAWLSETPDEPSIGWDAAAPRVVTWAELRPVNGGPLVHVFNTHFDHRGVIARLMSSSLLGGLISHIDDDEAVILTGDLNATTIDPTLYALNVQLDDSRTIAERSDLRGSLNWWRLPYGLISIDHIYVRGVDVNRFQTIHDGYGVDYLSDHFPVVAVVEL